VSGDLHQGRSVIYTKGRWGGREVLVHPCSFIRGRPLFYKWIQNKGIDNPLEGTLYPGVGFRHPPSDLH
jgi:hypothetical protein